MSANTITIDALRHIEHKCDTPFDLVFTLPDGSQSNVTCEKLVRAIPGKRLVFQASWQGRVVFAKIFLNAASSARDGVREQQGSEALSIVGIDTPVLLYAGSLPDRAYILLFDLIPDSMTFQQAWIESAGDKEIRRELVERMYYVFADLHNAGFLHMDPHQKNFLITKDVVYTLDCADIKDLGKAPGRMRAQDNLAIFFAIMHADIDDLVAASYPVYCEARGKGFYDISLSVLQSVIAEKRLHSREQYLAKKIFRECTEFVCKKQKGRYVVYRRDNDSGAIRSFIETPEQYIENHLNRYLKQGRSSTVANVGFDEKLFVVKRYNIKNLWKGVAHGWRRTRARQSWINAHRLVINGIRTAKPIILIENKFGPINLTSYFVTEYIPGPNIEKYLLTLSGNSNKRVAMVEKIRNIFQALRFHKLSHGDMKASNIIIDNDEPYLMDLDSMRKHTIDSIFASRHERDKQRFLRNWHNNETALSDFQKSLQIKE